MVTPNRPNGDRHRPRHSQPTTVLPFPWAHTTSASSLLPRRRPLAPPKHLDTPPLLLLRFSDGGARFMFASELFDLAALTAAGVDHVPLAQLRGLVETGAGGAGSEAGSEAGQGRGKGRRRQQQIREQQGKRRLQWEAGQGQGQGQGQRERQRRRAQREQEDEQEQEEEEEAEEQQEREADQAEPEDGGVVWDGRLDAVLFFRDTEFPPVGAGGWVVWVGGVARCCG